MIRWHVRLLLLCTVAVFVAGCSDTDHSTEPSSQVNLTGPSFTEIPQGTACMGDLIWNDLNCNGIQDDGEPGLGGIAVRLYECPSGVLVDQTVSDASGYYALFGPAPDDYYIVVDLPKGCTFSPADVGQGKERDVANDSDVNEKGVGFCTNLGDQEIQKDMDAGICCETKGVGCRVTGGGVDEFGNWDGTKANGRCANERYTFGGQAGANTALPPQPKGEWEHNNHSGPSGKFALHGGTSSAPDGTEIAVIECSDPGFCNPARPAPAHQIDFWGVGAFSNESNLSPVMAAAVVVGQSRHYFEVNIDDAGEPGRGKNVPKSCPSDGFGLRGSVALVDCNCPDFYRITIHATADPNSPVIYQVWGYPQGGNLQIHPLTGYDG